MKTLLESLKIVVLCVVAAIIYGVLHDQVTARACVEYFTIGHPPIFHTDDPTLLAFGWGVIATWWMGLILSIPAVFAARAGSWPTFDAADLVRPLACLMVVTAFVSLAAGIVGYFLANAGVIHLAGILGHRVPASKHGSVLGRWSSAPCRLRNGLRGRHCVVCVDTGSAEANAGTASTLNEEGRCKPCML